MTHHWLSRGEVDEHGNLESEVDQRPGWNRYFREREPIREGAVTSDDTPLTTDDLSAGINPPSDALLSQSSSDTIP